MNGAELLAEARERTGDLEEPYAVSDARFLRFLNEGERAACRNGRLIIDSTTAACCQIALVASTPSYALHAKILFIRRAWITGQSQPLRRIHHKDLDPMGSEWMAETGRIGDIEGFITSLDTARVRPYRIPSESMTLNLTVCRLPLEDFQAGDNPTDPEIHERFHEHLVDWAEFRFYSQNDPELGNPKLAAEALARFEAQFGKESAAIDEAWIAANYGYVEDEGLF